MGSRALGFRASGFRVRALGFWVSIKDLGGLLEGFGAVFGGLGVWGMAGFRF